MLTFLRFLFLLCTLFACFASSPALAEDWPQWLGPRRDSVWNPPANKQLVDLTQARPVWSAPINPGYSGVSVANGRVYTLDRPAAPPDHERVICLDESTGKPLWQFAYPATYGKLDYPKGPRAAPTIHDNRTFTLGAVGHLHCLDASTGHLVWSTDLVKDLGANLATWGFASAPLLHKDLVIVHAGVPPNGCYIAFEQATGKERWRSGTDPLGYGTPILISAAGQLQLIGWTPEHVVSMSPENGHENWRIPYKVTYGVSIATPIFAEGFVLVCGYWEGSKAIRLGPKPQDATLAWEENKFLRGLMAPPLYRDKHVYLLDKQHGIVCFELATGKKIWSDENKLTPRDRNPQASLVWLGDSPNILAVNTPGELIHARLTPAGYEEFARAKITQETWAHPAFAGDSIYARDDQQLVKVPLFR